MKRQLISIAVAGYGAAAITNHWASPPRQHSVNGEIETIDRASRTITLKAKDGATPLTFRVERQHALLAQGRMCPVQFCFRPDRAWLVSTRGRQERAARSRHKGHTCSLWRSVLLS